MQSTRVYQPALFRAALRQRGLRIQELHAAIVRRGIYVTTQTLYNWLRKGGCPDSEKFAVVCDVIGKPMDSFFAPTSHHSDEKRKTTNGS